MLLSQFEVLWFGGSNAADLIDVWSQALTQDHLFLHKRLAKKLVCDTEISLNVCMQGLSGALPDMGSAIASKLRAFSVGSTGLEQCRPNHLAAFGSKNYSGQVQPDCHSGCSGGAVLAV